MISKKSLARIGLTGSITLSSLILATNVLACDVYVDDNNKTNIEFGNKALPFNTITEGLNKAISGELICIASGTYKESLTIPENVSLKGSGTGKTIIKGTDNSFYAIQTSHGVNLSGFTLAIEETANINTGIYVPPETGVNIKKVEVNGADNYCFFFEGGGATKTDDIYDRYLEHSIASNCRKGVRLEKSQDFYGEALLIENHKEEGADIRMKSGKFYIKNSEARNNGESGFEIETGPKIKIEDTLSENSDRSSGFSFQYYGAKNDITLKNSKAYNNNDYGVKCDNKEDTIDWPDILTLISNVIKGNKEGAYSSTCD
jgi:hypothetical protein